MFKKNIRDFGEVYDYLKDGYLRVEKTGKQRITIKNADFPGEEFKETSWGYFDFVDCDFVSNYDISLEWLTNCTFTNCRFRGNFSLGQTIDVRFLRCKVVGESHLGLAEGRNLVFEDCEFLNSNADRNHIGSVICDGMLKFINCKSRFFAWKGYDALHLEGCATAGAVLGTASSGLFSDQSQMPYSDFLLEDCDFTRGVSMLNPKFNNLTLRRCKAGIFKTAGSIALGDVLVEGIKEGHVRLAASNFQGKLTVRNCSFHQPYDGHSFRCGGCLPTHTLLENITCASSPADVTSTFGPREEWKDPPPNKSLIIRHCKIPHLRADWAQTEHLRLENCELGDLYLRHGRIGRLEIIGCSLAKLDVTNTQVQTQDVRVVEGKKLSGHVTVTTGSNVKLYPR
jgi:hypothetical protein